MPQSSEYADHLHDLFAALGPPFSEGTSIRRMFGGLGIFCDGAMFGLAADDTLYLKTDVRNRQAFEAAGGEAFVYVKAGKPVEIAYLTLPDGALDEPESLRPWAASALAAALRARAAGRPTARK